MPIDAVLFPDPEATGPVAELPWGRDRCVALLENDPVAHGALRRVLESWGFRVVSAQTAEELTARLERDGRLTLDLVLTDFHLDREDGLEVICALRAIPAWSNTPALLVTGDLDPSTRQRAELLGVPVAYKPLTPRLLRGLTQNLIG